MFLLQLKNTDCIEIQNYRLLNSVIFENIPQISIQIIYTINKKGELDIFVVCAFFIVLMLCSLIGKALI